MTNAPTIPSPAVALAAWRCPWCQRSNDRDHEGLDTCEHCGSEAATHYDPADDTRLVVKWAYEPAPKPVNPEKPL